MVQVFFADIAWKTERKKCGACHNPHTHYHSIRIPDRSKSYNNILCITSHYAAFNDVLPMEKASHVAQHSVAQQWSQYVTLLLPLLLSHANERTNEWTNERIGMELNGTEYRQVQYITRIFRSFRPPRAFRRIERWSFLATVGVWNRWRMNGGKVPRARARGEEGGYNRGGEESS